MGAFFLVGGCEEEASREQENGDEIDSLVFASFTGLVDGEMSEDYETFLTYLEDRLEVTMEFEEITSTEALINGLDNDEIDFAVVSPLRVLDVEKEQTIEFLATGTRDPEGEMHQVVLVVPESSTANSIEELEGSTIALENISSTGLKDVPLWYVVNEQDLQAEEAEGYFREIIYSGTVDEYTLMFDDHGYPPDATLRALTRGEAEVAATYHWLANQLQGEISGTNVEDFRIIEEIGAIPSMTYIANEGVEEEILAELKEALLEAHEDPTVEEYIRGEENQRYEKFIPVEEADFDLLRDVEEAMGFSMNY